MAIDRDDDGIFDRTELDQGSNPFDVASPGELPPPEPYGVRSPWFGVYAGERANVPLDVDALSISQELGLQILFVPRHSNRRITFSFVDPQQAPVGASIDSSGTRFIWDVPSNEPAAHWLIPLRVLDNARPEAEQITLDIYVQELRIRRGPWIVRPEFSLIDWVSENEGFPGFPGFPHRYEVQVADSLGGPWRRRGTVHFRREWFEWNDAFKAPARFYRVVATH